MVLPVDYTRTPVNENALLLAKFAPTNVTI